MAPRQHWYSINKDLLSGKLSLFFEGGKEACYLPYLMLFLIGIGLDVKEAGLVTGLRFIGYIIGAPLWGYLADTKRKHRIIIFILCIMAILLNCSQPFISVYIGKTTMNRCPLLSNSSHLSFESIETNVNSKHKKDLFYVMLALNILISLFDGSTGGFVDAGVMRRINLSSTHVSYGREKVACGIGYSMFSIVSTIAIHYFPSWNVTCYSGIYIVYFIVTAGLTLSTNFLFDYKSTSNEEEQNKLTAGSMCESKIFEKDPSINIKLLHVLRKDDTVVFLLTVLFGGVCISLYFNFSMVFLKDLNASNINMGLSLVISGLVSFIGFLISKRLINVLQGTIETMCVCLFVWSIRFICLAYLYNPWLIIPLNTLNLLTFALLIASYVEHVKLISDSVIWTTMYGIMYSLLYGFGYMIANVAGGILYQMYGGRILFTGSSVAALLWCLLLAGYLVKTKSGKDEEKKEVLSDLLFNV